MNFLTIVLIFPSLFHCEMLAQSMLCSYGLRGSLTVYCYNAIPQFFQNTDYQFSTRDETLKCIKCNLEQIVSNTFDRDNLDIKTLDISNSKIRTLEKSSFIGLVYMTTLIMHSNFIELIIPKTFEGIKLLEVLDVSRNSLKRLVEDSFLELQYLKKLNLSYNKIVTIEAGAFDGLKALEELYLDHNLIENVCGYFAPLASVQIMKLQHNKIKIDSFCFTENPTVRDLDLSENEIKHLPPHAFKALTHLERLNLSFADIKTIDPDSFSNLYRLEVLDLKSNKISDIHRKLSRELHTLRDLDLSYNSISDFKTGYFSGISELRFLNLSYNKIECLQKTGILYLPNLRKLDFKDNKIQDIDYEIITTHLPRLTFMDITNNPLNSFIVPKIIEYFRTDDITLLISNHIGNKTYLDYDIPTKLTPVSRVYEDTSPQGHIIALYVLFALVLVFGITSIYLHYHRNRRYYNNAPLTYSCDLESK